ncbi:MULTISPECIES: hypothetical protein [unclassified Microbacterium]|uniref:hypothetical protein n=1 Tax=unclassified Microbacterium TaxID=2609290 RepID=UPI000CFB5AFD|nr:MULTISPECIES: hypothetical protein [unclassified Microbacterium]PQZ54791.1 hypothetical protein CQ032_12795 [Microbacterium sp. MYb43]PQZ77519.1 hypothetical protein CQ031_11405 [Microbacterium sp. MYb40]PRB19787.1 hypothetical protein CQ040_14345 [Microbacterium sp. MYb54]PRB25842.1 hypothetical protein CQ037_13975 [Microbacterium sp. MYb50]PRB64336.1 hypothetical protein CQ021_14405 [Microbacterium sp. MYb24]
MTEPLVWTLIGVVAAGMFGTITLISTMFLRTMQNGFDGVRTEMRNEFASVRTEMRNEFANVRTEIGAVHERIDHLDRDVNAIYRHLFGIDRG